MTRDALFKDRYQIVELESGEFAIQKRYFYRPPDGFGMIREMHEIVVRFTSIENARVWMKVNAPDQVKRVVE